MDARQQQPRGVGVSEVVDADASQLRPACKALERLEFDVGSCDYRRPAGTPGRAREENCRGWLLASIALSVSRCLFRI
jgi:hypothetical protein